MATAGSLDYFIRTIWQGGQGISEAMRSIGGLGQTAKQTDLQMAVARRNTLDYRKAMRALAKDVQAGKISMEAAEGRLKSMRQELGISEGQTRKSGLRWIELKSKIDLASQAFDTVRQVAAEAWQIVGEGAQLQLAEARFEKLAATIGTSSDSILEKFGAATGGMMTNAQMVASASQIISLNLADNETDVVRLGNVVGQLGLDMQQVIMTFANDSKMRLDALGLSITDVEERTKGYTDAGVEASKAFDLAVLDALEAKLELVGSAAGTTAGAMQRLEVGWTNITDTGKEWLALRLEGPIVGLANTIDAVGEASERGHGPLRNMAVVLNEINKAGGGVGGDRFIEWLDKGTKSAENLTDKAGKVVEVVEEISAVAESAQALGQLSWNLDETSQRLQYMALVAKDAATEDERLAVSAADVAAAEEARGLATQTAAENAAAAYARHYEAAEAAAEAQRLINVETADFFNQLAGNQELAAEYAAVLAQTGGTAQEAASSTELLNQKLFEQIQAHSENAAATALAGYHLGIYTEAEAEALLKSALLEEAIRKQAGAWDGTAEGLVAVQDNLQGYINTLNDMPSLIETEVRTNYTSTGSQGTPVGSATGGIPEHMARGGVVRGGVPGRDSVPALLMPGERVLTVAQNRAFERGELGGGDRSGGGGDVTQIYTQDRSDLVVAQMARRARERRMAGI